MDTDMWITVAGMGIGMVVLLIVAIIAFMAYRNMRRQRDQVLRKLGEAHTETNQARRERDEARKNLDEARAELAEARRELEDSHRDWHGATRQLTARLKEHGTKMSELLKVMKIRNEDRQTHQEMVAGYRKMADQGFGVLKRLVERQRNRITGDAEEQEDEEEAETLPAE